MTSIRSNHTNVRRKEGSWVLAVLSGFAWSGVVGLRFFGDDLLKSCIRGTLLQCGVTCNKGGRLFSQAGLSKK